MYKFLFKQLFRTKAYWFGLAFVFILGIVSLGIGKQFLTTKQTQSAQVTEKQENHLNRNIELHKDDLGLLLYYLKFSLINKTEPLSALSIGQNDVNPNVKSVKMLVLEGQKYDTDLVNPNKLVYGNLDFSFILIYLIPLLIIAFTFNLISEEEEIGTWRIVRIMSRSKTNYIFDKLFVRIVAILGVLILLFFLAILFIGIPLNLNFFTFLIVSVLYALFWFALCFFVISFKKSSAFNASSLLAIWLFLVVLIPAALNNYLTNKYPTPEAFSTMIKQRDGYHKKWDTNKRETMEAFYKTYPQYEKFGYPPEKGFNWIWYYAMHNAGDEEAKEFSKSLESKVLKREQQSRTWAKFFPTIHTQLTFNDLAQSSLSNQIDFLRQTNKFHEEIRLYFYPKIFSEKTAKDVDWKLFKPKHYQQKQKTEPLLAFLPLLVSILILSSLGIINLKRQIL